MNTLDTGGRSVPAEWIDYNGHMMDAYYFVAFKASVRAGELLSYRSQLLAHDAKRLHVFHQMMTLGGAEAATSEDDVPARGTREGAGDRDAIRSARRRRCARRRCPAAQFMAVFGPYSQRVGQGLPSPLGSQPHGAHHL